MAIQKKSLIGNLAAAKKAIVATNVASTPVAKTASPVGLAKGGAHQFAKGGAHQFAKGGAHQFAKGGAHQFAKGGPNNFAKGGAHQFAKGGPNNFAKGSVQLAKLAKKI